MSKAPPETFPGVVTCNGRPDQAYPGFKENAPDGTSDPKSFTSLKEALNDNSLSKLQLADYVVLLLYFLLVLGVGLWSMHQNKSRSTVKGYFLANKSMVWYTVGASLFASNIGSTHFIGLAGSGASGGWAAIAYEFNGMIVVQALSYLFLPVYLSCNVQTMPEYLKLRFGKNRLNFMISVISLLIYIFTKISVDLYAGAIFIQQAMHNVDIWQPICILLAITAIFTIGGGLSAVIYTDTIQAVIMIFGGIFVAVKSFAQLEDGYSSLRSEYLQADNSCWSRNLTRELAEVSGGKSDELLGDYLESCEKPPGNSFKIFRDISDDDFPWLGILTGMTINSVWYWCSDQVIVQRVLSAKNILHAKMATIFCSLLKVSVIFIMVMPGMISRILFPYTVGCSDTQVCLDFCNLERCNDVAYPHLVVKILPAGLVGLMVAVMMSSLLSSLTSIFNSASSIFTIDIWPKVKVWGRAPSEKELMVVGRVFVFILILVSVAWIPIVISNQTGSLFVYVQMVSSYFQPPICAIYIMGAFMPGINETGAFYGLTSGLLLGVLRMGLDMAVRKPDCLQSVLGVPDPRIDYLQKGFPFLIYACFIFVVTILVAYVVSFCTRPEGYVPPRRTYWQDRIQVTFVSKEQRKELEMQAKTASREQAHVVFDEKSPIDQANVKIDSSQESNLQSINGTTNNRAASSLPVWRKVLNFLCGFSEAEDDEKAKFLNNSLDSSPKIEIDETWKPVLEKKWDILVDVAAIVCVMVSVFMWFWFDQESPEVG